MNDLKTYLIVLNALGFNFVFISAKHFTWIYLIMINIITFFLFGFDKSMAIKNKRRIPNLVLLGLIFFGGTLGGKLGMTLFHHKTNKDYYTKGIKYIFAMQVILPVLIMNI